MKKILLLALPLMVMCFASCEKNNEEEWTDDSPIIQFKDPNFLKALLHVQEVPTFDEESMATMNVDTNDDGQISKREASVVKILYLYDWNTDMGFSISDVSEIKYFSSLEWLSCPGRNNTFTNLDLTGCPALKVLLCYDSPITILDVSSCQKLENVDCQYSDLQTLTISESQQNAEWLDVVKAEYPDIEIIVKSDNE